MGVGNNVDSRVWKDSRVKAKWSEVYLRWWVGSRLGSHKKITDAFPLSLS